MVPDITHLFVHNYTKQRLINLSEMQNLTDIILYVILMHMRNNSHNILMEVAALVLM